MTSCTASTGLEIAVVGLACRFPGAADAGTFWRNLVAGVESIRTFTDAELRAAGTPPALLAAPGYVKARPVLDDAEGFDAGFFGYSPREAALLDPQIRILHELAWHALEDAGYEPFAYRGAIALFAGVSSQLTWAAAQTPPGTAALDRRYVAELNSPSFATLIAYQLDLRGPAVAVQTACSTSLVAIHLAVHSLLSGEADLALAGGASLERPRYPGYLFLEGGIHSPDGHCRAFDAAAAGTVFGEGAGLVALKRLADAVRDGDFIYAVVKGSAINNDGRHKVSYNAPAAAGQTEVISAALGMAEVAPESISYVEAHGTGTRVGDPIEVEALTRAFATARRGFCALGTVKTNLGHLDAAAGVAGFIKTVLALKHGVLPASLNFRQANPAIDFAASPFYVNDHTRPWAGPLPRRAAVSSFGIGGTNAHVILEQAPPEPARPARAARPLPLVLSARTPGALAHLARHLAAHLRDHPELDLEDVAYTLRVGRALFPYRLVVTAATGEEAAAALATAALPTRPTPAAEPPDPPAFNGQPRRVPLPLYPFERQDGDASVPAPPPPEASLEAPSRAGRAELQAAIATVVKTWFGFERLDPHANFFELGASSPDLVNLGARLTQALGRELSPVTLFDHPSVAALAAFLAGATAAHVELPESAAYRAGPTAPPAAPGQRGAIAIIGMACRFPGAADLAGLWRNLVEGVESITFYSDAELQAAGVPEAHRRAPNYVKAKGELGDIWGFEPEFFGYSAREAELMDPQFRLFHECAWQALEHAGYAPEGYPGRIGVYAGATANLPWLTRVLPALGEAEQFAALLLNDREFFATLFSYKLDLRGPSLALQSACSTSLVNINLACRELLAGACDMALAGGVTVTIDRQGYFYQEGYINSPDGHTRTFDAAAAGTVFGDGAGVVLLKRLEDAVRDGDTLHAIIKGVGINNDGHRKVGFTAPSVAGQVEAIRAALRMAAVPVRTIGYVEAHGTGTRLGDPVEVEALTQAFQAEADGPLPAGYCHLGSIKSNFGHLNAAAGVAGLIKAVLALQRRRLPPSLFYADPNPAIDFAQGPFRVVQRLMDWTPENGVPRRAGVSSFGIGGTNAHTVLEEAPAAQPAAPGRPFQVLVLSALTPAALETLSERLAAHLETHPELALADVAFTLQVGRRRLPQRRTLVCASLDEAVRGLREPGRARSCQAVWENPSACFLFPGQGAQHPGMARELYRCEPAFAAPLDECFQTLGDLLSENPRRLLFEDAPGDAAIHRTRYTQPLLFAVSYSLARLLQTWGIGPAGLFGHSIGEYAAACLAGLFSLEDALTLVVARGRLMDSLPTGSMLSVPLSEAALAPYLDEDARLCLAAVNTRDACVVSGPHAAVEALCRTLEGRSITGVPLPTSHAFHSAMMDPILEDFAAVCRSIDFRAPERPWISSLDGQPVDAQRARTPEYWVRQLRQTVRCADGLGRLLAREESVLVEVGPGRTLSGFARRHPDYRGQPVFTLMRHPGESTPEQARLLEAVAGLWAHGLPVDWQRVCAHESRRRLPLPGYPFERRTFTVATDRDSARSPARRSATHKNPDLERWFYLPGWKRTLTSAARSSAGRLLILADEASLGQALAEHRPDAMLAVAGSNCAQLDSGRYSLDPDNPAHYSELMEALRQNRAIPDRVVCVTDLADTRPAAAARGYYRLMYTAQALAEAQFGRTIDIIAVSHGLFEVTGDEPLEPQRTLLLGPALVIPQEYQSLRCRLVDAGPLPWAGFSDWLTRLGAEIDADTHEPVVALRGPHRWVRTFEPVSLAEARPNTPGFRDGGVYVILGGLGNIGYTLARWLAGRHRARLVLTARSGLPPRSEWDGRPPGGRDRSATRIERVLALEALGAQVLVQAAILDDPGQVQALLAATEARFGRIDGVIHSAGLPDTFHPIAELVRSGEEDHFAAKVHGLRILREALKGREPDFCLLGSSLSTVLGGLGYASYAAVNAFMDAFALACTREGPYPWHCVNWDAWLFGTHQAAVGQSLARLAILPEEAEGLFDRLLPRLPAQIVISTADLEARSDQWLKRAVAPDDPSPAPARSQRPRLAQSYAAPGTPLEESLCALVADYCRLEQVGVHDNFFELGLESFDLIQLSGRLHRTTGREVPVVQLFTYPSVHALAAQLTAAAPVEPEEDLTLIERRARLRGRAGLAGNVEDEL